MPESAEKGGGASPRGFPLAWKRIRKLPACLTEDDSTLMMARWLAQRMYTAGWKAAMREMNAQIPTDIDQRVDRGEAAADADR